MSSEQKPHTGAALDGLKLAVGGGERTMIAKARAILYLYSDSEGKEQTGLSNDTMVTELVPRQRHARQAKATAGATSQQALGLSPRECLLGARSQVVGARGMGRGAGSGLRQGCGRGGPPSKGWIRCGRETTPLPRQNLETTSKWAYARRSGDAVCGLLYRRSRLPTISYTVTEALLILHRVRRGLPQFPAPELHSTSDPFYRPVISHPAVQSQRNHIPIENYI